MFTLTVFHAAVLPTHFHLIKCRIRTPHELWTVISKNRILRKAQWNGKCMLFTFTIKFLCFFCKLLKKRLNLHCRAIRHENAKLIASVSAEYDILWKILLHALCKLPQYTITRHMSIHIVDQLEIINIKHRHNTVLLRVLSHILLNLIIKAEPVVDTCQCVSQSKSLEILSVFIDENQWCYKPCQKQDYNYTSDE